MGVTPEVIAAFLRVLQRFQRETTQRLGAQEQYAVDQVTSYLSGLQEVCKPRLRCLANELPSDVADPGSLLLGRCRMSAHCATKVHGAVAMSNPAFPMHNLSCKRSAALCEMLQVRI